MFRTVRALTTYSRARIMPTFNYLVSPKSKFLFFFAKMISSVHSFRKIKNSIFFLFGATILYNLYIYCNEYNIYYILLQAIRTRACGGSIDRYIRCWYRFLYWVQSITETVIISSFVQSSKTNVQKLFLENSKKIIRPKNIFLDFPKIFQNFQDFLKIVLKNFIF